MKRIFLIITSIFCVSCASANNYQGYTLERVISACYESGAQTFQISKCVHDVYYGLKLDIRGDEEYGTIATYLELLDKLGYQANFGQITEEEAREKAMTAYKNIYNHRFGLDMNGGTGGNVFCSFKADGAKVVQSCK